MWIVRNLGLVGLYKGASACLLRDGRCLCGGVGVEVETMADERCFLL